VSKLPVGFDKSLWEDILFEASRLGVLPMLYFSLQNAGILADFPEEFVARCKESWRQTTLANMRLLHDFSQIALLFQAADIPIIALKGIYLANHVYPHSGMRQMGDIDLLIPESDLPSAREILFHLGYTQLDVVAYDNIQAEIEIAHHLAPFVKEGSPTIELHWHIVKPGEGHYVFPAEELWRRTVACQIGTSSTLALTREALLVHLCMHVSYHHLFAFGLRPLYDVHTLISLYGDTLDWDEIASIGASWRVAAGIHLTLAVVQQLFGTPIPPHYQNADKIPGELLDTVIEQILADASDSHNLTLLAKLYSSGSVWERLGTGFKRIFVQPHPIFSRSYLRFLLARTARLFTLYQQDLLRLYGPKRDQALVDKATRYAKIYRWLK